MPVKSLVQAASPSRHAEAVAMLMIMLLLFIAVPGCYGLSHSWLKEGCEKSMVTISCPMDFTSESGLIVDEARISVSTSTETVLIMAGARYLLQDSIYTS